MVVVTTTTKRALVTTAGLVLQKGTRVGWQDVIRAAIQAAHTFLAPTKDTLFLTVHTVLVDHRRGHAGTKRAGLGANLGARSAVHRSGADRYG
jgi:hypothetical protein